jgi:hypothetical protein
MTDTSATASVTPLPVKAKRADNTAALRQRRRRAKRKPGTHVTATTIERVTQPGKTSRSWRAAWRPGR